MKKTILFLMFTSLVILHSSCDQKTLNAVLKAAQDAAGGGSLTEGEVASGLKSALEVGAKNSVKILAVEDGYFKDQAVKILLPDQVDGVITKMNSTSGGKKIYDATVKPIVDDMVLSLNRSAEDAAEKAVPIFVNAITSMSIQDAFGILRGTDTAATHYLRERTFKPLVDAFAPSINQSLDKPLVGSKSANKVYGNFVNTYNDIEKGDMLNLLKLEPIKETDLGSYVTHRALEGLFSKVAIEEKKIREDPIARVNDILKKVFGSLDKE